MPPSHNSSEDCLYVLKLPTFLPTGLQKSAGTIHFMFGGLYGASQTVLKTLGQHFGGVFHQIEGRQQFESFLFESLIPLPSINCFFLRWQTQRRFHDRWVVWVVLKWCNWNIPLQATYWLATRCNSAAAHWSDPNIFDKIWFQRPVCNGITSVAASSVFPVYSISLMSQM